MDNSLILSVKYDSFPSILTNKYIERDIGKPILATRFCKSKFTILDYTTKSYEVVPVSTILASTKEASSSPLGKNILLDSIKVIVAFTSASVKSYLGLSTDIDTFLSPVVLKYINNFFLVSIKLPPVNLNNNLVKI